MIGSSVPSAGYRFPNTGISSERYEALSGNPSRSGLLASFGPGDLGWKRADIGQSGARQRVPERGVLEGNLHPFAQRHVAPGGVEEVRSREGEGACSLGFWQFHEQCLPRESGKEISIGIQAGDPECLAGCHLLREYGKLAEKEV